MKPMVAKVSVMKAGKRPEAEHRHQKDGDDDLVERARQSDEAAAEQVDPASAPGCAPRRAPPGSTAATPTAVEVTVMVRLS
jgi:hypothetical protein